jgi:hypothetical protein
MLKQSIVIDMVEEYADSYSVLDESEIDVEYDNSLRDALHHLVVHDIEIDDEDIVELAKEVLYQYIIEGYVYVPLYPGSDEGLHSNSADEIVNQLYCWKT